MYENKLNNILKISTILIVLLCSKNLLAQDVTLSLNLKNVTVKEALEQLKNDTKFSLWFNVNDVELSKIVTVQLENKSIEDALKIILDGQNLNFEVKNKRIQIFKHKTNVEKPKQKVKNITGLVTDESGEVLPGVTIQIEGSTSTGTITDFDGKFQLDVPDNAKRFIVSYVGMKTQELNIAPGFTKIVLLSDSQELDEVVVTGYQKIDRRLFTGAADRISGDKAKVDGVTDISKMLQGKTAGVQVQSVSGTFGAAPKIRVRGASSIYGNQSPLWVVDGVVLEDVVEVSPDDLSSGNAATLISSAVAGLNADDIESFQILKDASATALYGARAMNGVIVVTTKKGKKGTASISYTGEFTMRTRPSYSQYNIMNSKDQMSVYLDMEQKGWLDHATISRAENGGVFFQMYDLINQFDKTNGQFGLMNTPQSRSRFLQSAEMRNTDWFSVLFKPTLQSNHSLSISSGNERSRFYTSLSFYNDPGWTDADKVNRYTANMNASFDLNKYLTFGVNTSGSIRNQRVPGTMDRDMDAVNGEYTRDFDINPFSYALNTSRTMSAYTANGDPEYYRMNYAPFSILNEMNSNFIDMDMMDLKLQMELNYKPFKTLELNALGAIRYVKSTQEHKIYGNSNMAMAYRAADDATIRDKNKFLYKDPDNPDALPEVVMPEGGFYNTTNNTMLSYYFRATANYNKMLFGKHPFNLMVGQEIKSADRKSGFNNGYGYQWDKGGVPSVDYRILQQILVGGFDYYGMEENYDRFVAFFGTASFSYNGKYTLNLTGRYDGSNRLGRARDSRWLPSWNVSGSWNALEESFMKTQPLFSALTLRATYGLTASMGPASNALAIFRNQVTFRDTQGNRENQVLISSLQNSELTWEKQYETNVGIDMGFLHNRISLSADAYFRNGFDLIGYMRTSGIGGEAMKAANYADMKSRGVEFTLNTKNIVTKNFNWTSNLTFSFNHNEITNLKSMPRVIDLVKEEGGPLQGYPVRGLFSYQFKGLDSNGFPTFINEDGELTSTDINFQENNNIGHLKYEGSIDPKVTGGFDNGFMYKNWKMNVYFTYQFGNVIRLYPEFSAVYSDMSAMPKEMKNRWMQAGNEKYTDVPGIPSKRQVSNIENLNVAYNAYNYSDARVANGSFIRLKEISLSYDFKGNWMKAVGMNNLQLRCVASNLWLIYSDKKLNGQDPEFFRSGGVAMPTPRQFTLSVRTSF